MNNYTIIKKLAQDETTSPETLRELARHEDCQVRQYVAKNPNTPVEVLLNICFEFPSEVINNPVIPLLLLEDPYILTCEIFLDFNQIKALTDKEIRRLGWTKDQGRNYLFAKYGKRSRLQLTDTQMVEFLVQLRSIT